MYNIFNRVCKGFIYQNIRYYSANGKEAQDEIKARKKELRRIFKREFHLNAFGITQGKGTSNNGMN